LPKDGNSILHRQGQVSSRKISESQDMRLCFS
jgi:hypothetical protein